MADGKIKNGEVRNPYGRRGKPKPKTNSDASIMTSRARLANQAGKHFGGDRDLYETMGYPRVLLPEDYTDAYKRGDIAGRIIDAYPDATWREAPDFKADEKFLNTWKALDNKYQLWRTFHRLDRLVNLGHYGILVMGLDGAEPMNEPAKGKDYNLIYLQPHSERTAMVTKWENDPTNPRYGLPVLYRVTTGVNWTGVGAGQRVVVVHHSRVIHIAERPLEDVSIGMPRLERVFNRLMDTDKLAGAAPEMYWQNVAMIMAFMSEANTEIDPEAAKDMKAQLEEMQHGLRRFLTLQGVTGENLAPGLQGSDPSSTFSMLIDLIAGATGIPKRILLGNEAGELASSQDENNWQARIVERREQFAGPTIIEAFIRAGQKLGFLPAGFEELEWPEADTLGDQGRAEVAEKKSNAIAAYTNTIGSELVVKPDEFRAMLGLDPLQADTPEEDIDESDPEVISMAGRRKSV